MGAKENKELIIKKLISLKIVLFIFFGGLGCLFPFLPHHMLSVGLNREESGLISIISPLVSILGALIFCPLADNLATKKGATGKHLRIIAAITMIIGPLLYISLAFVPSVERFESKKPTVSFACDLDGALLYQKRINEQRSCYYWESAKTGSFVLTNCSYTCQNPAQFEKMYTPWNSGAAYSDASPEDEYDSVLGDPNDDPSLDNLNHKENETGIEPPHLCKEGIEKDDPIVCHVYTDETNNLTLTATLRGAINQENDTHSAEWCKYPLDGFKCNIPQKQIKLMNEKKTKNLSICEPMIECDIADPYESPGSILDVTLRIGDPDYTFWVYLAIRSFADMFPIATIAILNAAIIIATRETSSGRGDVGHQYVWASIGFAIFSPIVGAIEPHTSSYLVPMIMFLIMSLLAALVILSSSDMPLSPPEWWWHTKSGMVAIPMSSIRKYGAETAGLALVSILLGSLWSLIDSYQGWYLKDLTNDIIESNILISITLTIGALAAIPFLWFAEKIIDYCGHSNILITSFAVYVIRFILMAEIQSAWLILFLEAMEPLTLGLTWITIVLYMRHIIPRRMTATGQAIPVIAHFCIGKSIGAAFGFIESGTTNLESFRKVYLIMAVYALVIAVVYFILYHCILAPLCGAGPIPKPPTGLLEGMRSNGAGGNGNPNGNYTPLRVYHNGRGRKGQFRY